MPRQLDFFDYRRKISYPSTGLRSAFAFGYESEFSDIKTALKFYAPLPDLGLDGLDEAAQAEGVRALCRSLGHGDKRPLLEKKAGPDFLPRYLHRDDTGNVELALGPMDSLLEFETQTRWAEKEIGLGSLQAMVSLSRERFFAEGFLPVLGWLNFFNELDVLERLERGYERWQGSPDREVVRSFLHPYLGPMIALRHKLLRKFLRENSLGEMLDPESLIRPARRDQSFKFVGSTAYRPDVAGPARICLEVRDTHRDPELLRQRVARILFHWERPLAPFSVFAELPPFDSGEAFAAMPEEIRAWLVATTPNRAPPEVLGFEKPRFTYEVYRNFAYPLRSWLPWLELLEPSAIPRVAAAQADYLRRLSEALGTSGGEARALAQGALACFGRESGLYGIFRRREDRMAEGRWSC